MFILSQFTHFRSATSEAKAKGGYVPLLHRISPEIPLPKSTLPHFDKRRPVLTASNPRLKKELGANLALFVHLITALSQSSAHLPDLAFLERILVSDFAEATQPPDPVLEESDLLLFTQQKLIESATAPTAMMTVQEFSL
eukprot:TRINITY_DN6902_c0_g1_i3.p1 TRINITY_DN6902_c0_g1~~TRINITY_DN6902_c0_g1_i3.p1  ORF type:complete len:140 (+),score=10.23 TRINITY_DN6902_c0_g1_i3:102-521(+)